MSTVYEIAIIGSGPAGLSAAARAAELGISHVLIEKSGRLSDTIQKYQKKKLIMATPVQLPLRSSLSFAEGSKEDILEIWQKGATSLNVNVRYNSEFSSISGAKGNFRISLKGGDEVSAAHIILAIGTQGNFNKLTCEGADLSTVKVQYQLDDPGEYKDEHIFVIGAGDAGIENALGLVADPAQNNFVTLINKNVDFPTAKRPNVDKVLATLASNKRFSLISEGVTSKIEPGFITVKVPTGETRLRCDRIIARIGTSPPRKSIEPFGIEFTSPDRNAFPRLSSTFESTVPGIYIVGALAGYPLIKHCMNQGYDVVEYIRGNTQLAPADEDLIAKRLSHLPEQRSVTEWITYLRSRVPILNFVSPLQMREFLLDANVRSFQKGSTIFNRGDVGSSLFAIAEGTVTIHADSKRGSAAIANVVAGSIFGEVGLLSGRPRGATIRAADRVVAVEIERTGVQKLMSEHSEVRDIIEKVTLERLILQTFDSSLEPSDVAEVLSTAKILTVEPDQAIIEEGDEGIDLFIIRNGSMKVEKKIGGRVVFLNFVPANSVVGEMAMLSEGRRSATVRANLRSLVVRLDGSVFLRLMNRKPSLRMKLQALFDERSKMNAFTEEQVQKSANIAELYTARAQFLLDHKKSNQAVAEATDVLLIDETLCIGCDNCEKACADAHDGLSRLIREAGRTFDHLHVPTSCRHCEQPHCMADCPPNAIHRGQAGEISINSDCIGCGNCARACPYGVIRMDKPPPPKPPLINWILFGKGPGPGEPDRAWKEQKPKGDQDPAKSAGKKTVAIKCDMCATRADKRPVCVKACPTGAAIRVAPQEYLEVARRNRTRN